MSAKAKTGKVKFPTRELKTWLKGRKGWNHNEWLALLADLRGKGYAALTDIQDGRESIGKFLETNRSK